MTIILVFNGTQAIRQRLNKLVTNMENTAREFGNTSQVSYWDNEGKESIDTLLKSEGYYGVQVTSTITHIKGKHYKIEFLVELGKRYRLNSLVIEHTKNSNKTVVLPRIDKLKSKVGNFVIAEKIIQDQKAILEELEQNNCLLNLSVNHEAIVNHVDTTVAVKFIVEAGNQARIKEVDYRGIKSIKEEYLKKITPLTPGMCYQKTKILKAREQLQRSGLFSSTTPEIPKTTDEKGEVPVVFHLKERKHRSVKAGLSYGTDLGPGITTGWEHRNFFSSGEEVRISSFINKKEQLANINYTQPFFKRDDQKLKIGASAENTKHKAFDSREGKVFSGVERDLGNNFEGGVSSKITVSRIKEKNKAGDNFTLLSVPLFLSLDKRDNILDAHKGFLIRADSEPFIDTGDKDNAFFKNSVAARYYINAGFHKKAVIALKGVVGSIFGKNASKIPATERFFVGGGSSVRGYAFQLVGPLNKSKIPVGGKSYFETSVEYRYMRDDNIGFVTFVDSGAVYADHLPDFKEKIFHGAGIGLRYNTDFGPIRADIAVPLLRRKGVDRTFQLYFGIGQSF